MDMTPLSRSILSKVFINLSACLAAILALRLHIGAFVPNNFSQNFQDLSQSVILGYSPQARYLDFVLILIIGYNIISISISITQFRYLRNFFSYRVATSWKALSILISILLVIKYLLIFQPTLNDELWATHEGEWVGGASSPCIRFIHGWVVNCLPARLSLLAPANHQIFFGRAFRLVVGALPFLLAPATIYFALKADVWDHGRDQPADTTSSGMRKVSYTAACLLLVVTPASILSFGDPDFSIVHIPVRDVSLILIALAALGAIEAQNAGSNRQRLQAWCCYGVVSAVAFLCNILALVEASIIALAPMLHFLSGADRSKLKSLVFPLAAAASCGASLLLIWLFLPEAIEGSINSFVFFSRFGNLIFPDQYISGISPLSDRTLSAILITAAAMVFVAGKLRKGLSEFHREGALLALIACCIVNVFLITGNVTSSAGPMLLCSYFVGRVVWKGLLGLQVNWKRIGNPEETAQIAKLIFLSILALFLIQTSSLAQALLDTRHRADGSYMSFDLMEYVNAHDGNDGCYFSLRSEDAIAQASHVATCSREGPPWYSAALDQQRGLIQVLERRKPDVVHVASVGSDNLYAPERHLRVLARWVYAHYCPGPIIDGRWFWTIASTKCPLPALPAETAAEEVPVGDFRPLKLRIINKDIKEADTGLILVDSSNASIVAAVVATQNSPCFSSSGVCRAVSRNRSEFSFSILPTADMVDRKLAVFAMSSDGAISYVKSYRFK